MSTRNALLVMLTMIVIVLIIGAVLFSVDQSQRLNRNSSALQQAGTNAAATVMAEP